MNAKDKTIVVRIGLILILCLIGMFFPVLFIVAAWLGWTIYDDTVKTPPPPPPDEWYARRWTTTAADPRWRSDFLAFCESPAETKFLEAMIDAHGLTPNNGVLKGSGLTLDLQVTVNPYRLDFLANTWLVVEIDGAAYHSSPEAVASDKKRDEFLRTQGYAVLRIPAKVVFATPEEAVCRVRTAIAAGRTALNAVVTERPPQAGVELGSRTAEQRSRGTSLSFVNIVSALNDAKSQNKLTDGRQLSIAAQLQQDIDRGRLVAILKRVLPMDAVAFIEYSQALDGDLIERFEDRWDWKALSRNKSLPWSLQLLARFEEHWDWKALTSDISLPLSLELLARFEDRWYWGGDRGAFDFSPKGLSANEALPWSLELLKRFAIRWNWRNLSCNKALPWSLELLEHFENRWNWGSSKVSLIEELRGLSANEALPWSLELLERFAIRWNWVRLSENEALPWSLELLEFEHFRDRWVWWGLSANKALPWSLELLERFRDRWVWWRLSANEALPWSLKLLERFEDRWGWGSLSEKEALPWSLELIERFRDRWDWNRLSENQTLPWSLELLERFVDRWDWNKLSKDQVLPWSLKLIERFEDRWDWDNLSKNNALPWSPELINRFPWMANSISRNSVVPLSFERIERNADVFDWKSLSCNTALPWSLALIERFVDRWDWSNLSGNKSLPWSLELLERFEDRWVWKYLTGNQSLSLPLLRPIDIDEIISHHFPGSDTKPANKEMPSNHLHFFLPKPANKEIPLILTQPQTSEQAQVSNPATQSDAGTDRMLKVRPRRILTQPHTSKQAQIGNLAKQSDAVLTLRRANIKALIAEQGIRHLIHFTRVANLESIMNHGLLSVQTAHQQGVVPLANDQLRLDGHKDAISLSIGFPNSAMFYKYRQLHPQDRWVVLLLRPEILWTHDCAYCLHNAADKRISSRLWSELTSDEAFQSMFAEAPDGAPSRTVQRLGLSDPTDMQAEVLVRGNITPSMLVEMVFEHPDDLEAHRHRTGLRIVPVHVGSTTLRLFYGPVARVVQVPGSDFFASRRFARNGGVG